MQSLSQSVTNLFSLFHKISPSGTTINTSSFPCHYFLSLSPSQDPGWSFQLENHLQASPWTAAVVLLTPMSEQLKRSTCSKDHLLLLLPLMGGEGETAECCLTQQLPTGGTGWAMLKLHFPEASWILHLTTFGYHHKPKPFSVPRLVEAHPCPIDTSTGMV